MVELAGQYAEELNTQFRRLNSFSRHAGEIGRSHEAYLRGVIKRFLPSKYDVGTGFVSSVKSVSTQQDVIVYNQLDYPTLLSVGDCVIIDSNAIAATLEVKTRIGTRQEFLDVYRGLADFYRHIGNAHFVGLYLWEGLSLKSALEVIWKHVRENPGQNSTNLPSAIYVRSKYLLLNNEDGRLDTPPLRLLNISNTTCTEGQALLTLIAAIWMVGIRTDGLAPWWLESWEQSMQKLMIPVSWPDDLKHMMRTSVTAQSANEMPLE